MGPLEGIAEVITWAEDYWRKSVKNKLCLISVFALLLVFSYLPPLHRKMPMSIVVACALILWILFALLNGSVFIWSRVRQYKHHKNRALLLRQIIIPTFALVISWLIVVYGYAIMPYLESLIIHIYD